MLVIRSTRPSDDDSSVEETLERLQVELGVETTLETARSPVERVNSSDSPAREADDTVKSGSEALSTD